MLQGNGPREIATTPHPLTRCPRCSFACPLIATSPLKSRCRSALRLPHSNYKAPSCFAATQLGLARSSCRRQRSPCSSRPRVATQPPSHITHHLIIPRQVPVFRISTSSRKASNLSPVCAATTTVNARLPSLAPPPLPMVSYPDDATSTRSSHFSLPFRRSAAARSPSVASSSRAPSISTTVRRHRHGRSHAGGPGAVAKAVQNEFPVFAASGDVEIVITDRAGRREQRYVLHRLILAQCSGFFEAGTSDEWSATGPGAGANHLGSDGSVVSRSSSEFAGRRWKYELDWGSNGDDIPMLVQKVHDPSARTVEIECGVVCIEI